MSFSRKAALALTGLAAEAGVRPHEDNGYVAPWANWENSPVVQFHL